MAVAFRRRHIKLNTLRHIEHAVLVRARRRSRRTRRIGFIFLGSQRNYRSHLRALVFYEPDERNELRLRVPTLIYSAVIRQRKDIVVEVIVSFNNLVNRQIAVARVAVAVKLSLVYSPGIPVNGRIRVCYVIVYFLRSRSFASLCICTENKRGCGDGYA